jgi:hypothetical protein
MLATGAVFGATLYLLLFAPTLIPSLFILPPVSLLWLVYLVYTISAVMLLHFIIFRREAALAEEGHHLSKRLPKYLEYAYTVTVAASLVQIFVFTPRMADYVTWLQGDESYVGNQIKLAAQSYLKNECIKSGATQEYCVKLRKIVAAPDVTHYIVQSVVIDPALLDPDFYAEKEGGVVRDYTSLPLWRQPQDNISELVNRFKVVHEYVSLKGNGSSAGSNRLAWVGILLLPIGIALRMVKTSVELFVPLE